MKKRSLFIDHIRGQAVLWMIIFHAAYDLTLFRVLHLDFSNGFWFWLPRYIVASFFICVGASLRIAYKNNIVWPKFWKRFLKIAAGAVIISIVTYVLFPTRWVYFGTLHCIAVASILGLPLVKYPKTALILGLSILVSMPILGINFRNLSAMTSIKSMDFIPIYPWFAAVCLGIYLSDKMIKVHYHQELKIFKFFSLHAFKIYVVHQPLLYGLSYLISQMIH